MKMYKRDDIFTQKSTKYRLHKTIIMGYTNIVDSENLLTAITRCVVVTGAFYGTCS